MRSRILDNLKYPNVSSDWMFWSVISDQWGDVFEISLKWKSLWISGAGSCTQARPRPWWCCPGWCSKVGSERVTRVENWIKRQNCGLWGFKSDQRTSSPPGAPLKLITTALHFAKRILSRHLIYTATIFVVNILCFYRRNILLLIKFIIFQFIQWVNNTPM